MSNNRATAKRLLTHYFERAFHGMGLPLDEDCLAEIGSITDAIFDEIETVSVPGPGPEELRHIKELAIEALETDGTHHKQWYLEKILDQCTYKDTRVIRGDWKPGIAP